MLGDNGIVRRGGNIGFGTLADVDQVETTDTTQTTGGNDTIVSNGGVNVIVGGVGADTITANGASDNIILGDNGVVNMNQAGRERHLHDGSDASAATTRSPPRARATTSCSAARAAT